MRKRNLEGVAYKSCGARRSREFVMADVGIAVCVCVLTVVLSNILFSKNSEGIHISSDSRRTFFL